MAELRKMINAAEIDDNGEINLPEKIVLSKGKEKGTSSGDKFHTST